MNLEIATQISSLLIRALPISYLNCQDLRAAVVSILTLMCMPRGSHLTLNYLQLTLVVYLRKYSSVPLKIRDTLFSPGEVWFIVEISY